MAQHERRASDDFSEVSSLHEGMSQEVSRQEAPPEPDHLKSHLSTRQYESPDPTNSTQTSLGKEQQRDDQSNLGFAKPLDTQFLGFWLMLLYIFAAIVSWTVTCILSYRPIALPGSIGGLSYDDQSGTIYSKNWTYSERWRQAASIGSAVVAAVGIPVTSAICAKATAVYCERRSKAQRPSLTLRQTIALADHGWSDLGVIRNLFRPSTSRRTRSRLLVVSTGLAGLGKNSQSCSETEFQRSLLLKSPCYSGTPERVGEVRSHPSLIRRNQIANSRITNAPLEAAILESAVHHSLRDVGYVGYQSWRQAAFHLA